MVSVTQRIRQIKQPYGGYIDPKWMERIVFEDNKQLGEENLPPQDIGTVVDYLSRWQYDGNLASAFEISIIGALHGGKYTEIMTYLSSITNLEDNESIRNACRAIQYDRYLREGKPPETNPSEIYANEGTCENIRIMVERSQNFFSKYGPITQYGPTFHNGYSKTVDSGDGDFLTSDTIWDFKVSKYSPKPEHTLQLLMYYLLGKRSDNMYCHSLKKIGIFNPRLNTAYILAVSEIPEEIIKTVEKDVLGFE